MHANKREDVEQASAGEIVAVAGLKQVTTGDTICAESHPIVLEALGIPRTGISQAIEPKRDKTRKSLALDSSASRPKTRASRFLLTRRQGRRSLAEWVSCIWKSLSIA
jgi:elongation factor G